MTRWMWQWQEMIRSVKTLIIRQIEAPRLVRVDGSLFDIKAVSLCDGCLSLCANRGLMEVRWGIMAADCSPCFSSVASVSSLSSSRWLLMSPASKWGAVIWWLVARRPCHYGPLKFGDGVQSFLWKHFSKMCLCGFVLMWLCFYFMSLI